MPKNLAKKISIKCTINGVERTLEAYPMERFLDTLREEGKLTGTKEGCGEGECGACSIFVDGEIVNSCLIPTLQMNNAKITTVEGLAEGETLNKIQQAFLEFGGAQCGICTPGMLLAATNILNKNPKPTRDDVKEGLAGNLCRCTGYMKIFDSVLAACQEARV